MMMMKVSQEVAVLLDQLILANQEQVFIGKTAETLIICWLLNSMNDETIQDNGTLIWAEFIKYDRHVQN